MQYKQALKYFGAVGASFFTAIMTAICILFFIFGTNPSEETFKLLQPERILLVLLLSFVMSAGSTVYHYAPISKTAAICLHAAIYNAGFFAFLWATVAGYEENIGKRFVIVTVGTLVLAVIYVAVTLLLRMIARTLGTPQKKSASNVTSKKEKSQQSSQKPVKQKKNKKEPYESQFS